MIQAMPEIQASDGAQPRMDTSELRAARKQPMPKKRKASEQRIQRADGTTEPVHVDLAGQQPAQPARPAGESYRDNRELIEAVRAMQERLDSIEAAGQSTTGQRATGEVAGVIKRIEAVEARIQKREMQARASEHRAAREGTPNAGIAEEQDKFNAAFSRFLRASGMAGASGQSADVASAHADMEAASQQLANMGRAGTMIVSDPETGGYLAPPHFVEGMIELLRERNPIRGIVRSIPVPSGMSLWMDRQTAHATMTWTGESTEREDQSLEPFGRREIPIHEGDIRILVSRRNLMNTRIDLGRYLMQEMAETAAIEEELQFVNGDGVAKPRGITTDTDTHSITTETTNVLAADDLIAATYVLLERYQRGASWILRRSSLAKIRQMKTAGYGYIWGRNLQEPHRTMTILDYPYTLCDAMPDLSRGTNTGKVGLMFGDFRMGYAIGDRSSLMFQVDPYSESKVGAIRYSAWKYVGGDVYNPPAMLRILVK